MSRRERTPATGALHEDEKDGIGWRAGTGFHDGGGVPQTASDAAGTTAKKGTYLHQQNKSHKKKGAAAAQVAASLGTNDKGQPH